MKRTHSNASLPDLHGKHPPTNKTPTAQVSYVKQHIESFPVVDSHYCRKDSSKGYLDNNLSIRVMFNLYKEKAFLDNEPMVSEYVYRDIFNTQYNLSFFHPKKDKCDLCHRYDSDLVEKTEYDIHQENKNLSNHQRAADKAKAHAEKDFHVCAIDMKHVLHVPHSNFGTIYYIQKLNVYNCSDYSLGNKNGTCFVWSEADFSC